MSISLISNADGSGSVSINGNQAINLSSAGTISYPNTTAPTAPTQTLGNSTTAIATTAFTQTAIQAAPIARAYGFCTWNGAMLTTPKALNATVTRSNTGRFTVTFNTPLADANYVVCATSGYSPSYPGYLIYEDTRVLARSNSSFNLSCTGGSGYQDPPFFSFVVFG